MIWTLNTPVDAYWDWRACLSKAIDTIPETHAPGSLNVFYNMDNVFGISLFALGAFDDHAGLYAWQNDAEVAKI